MKIRNKRKRKLKAKIKRLKKEFQKGNMTSKEAKKYLAGHLGYLKPADVYNLTSKSTTNSNNNISPRGALILFLIIFFTENIP